ncbi:hypothetical protein CFII64_20563 [Pseudomonas sp. CFII64]|jgi:hypothetical protein|uniref:hypothetical protein n=1 Tax=Pseudomonas sp. CFII64 TaxID=911242 RepID=UPI000357E3FD|nr:hypothetical protein [Pseudomonas sp. CFII64]EPJ79649.1 hypothetical protein CFII64_20563 [Pseudomonas sp. CFII64]
MKIIVVCLVGLFLVLTVGYYDVSQEDAPDTTLFFWKKAPTFQVKFINIATEHWGADWALTDENRQSVVDYCKYRLGVETRLDHPDDVKKCTKS